MDKKRIEWLNGLKGLACMGVAIHHFTLIYFPAAYGGRTAASHLYNIDTWLADAPFNFFLNGNFWVFIFILLSGYVVFRKVQQLDKKEIGEFIISRYLKLLFPVFLIEAIILAISKMSIYPYHQDVIGEYSVWHLIYSAWYKVPVLGDNSYIGAFGMLQYIFLGTFIAIIFAMLKEAVNSKSFLIISFILMVFLFLNQQWFFCVLVMGICICFMQENGHKTQKKWSNLLMLLCGLFLGGYPTGVIKPEGIYRFIYFFDVASPWIWHLLGAGLIVIAIANLRGVQKVLQFNIFKKLGGISYAVYLFHWLIITSFLPIFDKIYFADDTVKRIIIFIIDFAVIIIVSHLFTKYIYNPFCKLVPHLIKKMQSNNHDYHEML